MGRPRKFNEALTGGWTLEMVNLRLGATWKSTKAVALKRLSGLMSQDKASQADSGMLASTS